MAGGYGVMGDDGSIDYTVHEAWNEATNVYLIVILVSFGLFMYARRNKRKIMRIFSVPPMSETLTEPNFYDTMSKIRLRQQLEMYSILPTWILLNPPKRPMIFFAKTFAISLPFSREFSKSGGCGLQNSSAGCQLFSDETLQTWLRRSSDDRHIIYTQSLSRPVIFSSED